jgi:O-antigen/teichoic acid export membrane protein
MLLRFISMFIVIPFLSKEPSIYGIYAFCISVVFFLGYADFGFLNASQKYAAECVAKNEGTREIEFVGFGSYILFSFTFLFSIVFFYFGFNPHCLIKGIDNIEKLNTAKNLFYIIAVFAPVTALQRTLSMIFDIRLDSYKVQRVFILSSLISISSVWFFFGNGKYEIVSYFLFTQIVNFFSLILGFYLAKRHYLYDFKGLVKNVRWSSDIYKKVKSLSFSGLYVMILWILFYELDSVIIGRTIGTEEVALYAIAFSFASLFRSLFAILYSPFLVRMNYFISNGDEKGLNNFIVQLILFTSPLVLYPTIAVAIISKPLILTWVGPAYNESIYLMRCFVLAYSLSFISYTFSTMLYAKSGIKEMYVLSTIQTLVYWIGVALSFSFFGLLSFGLFKLITAVFSEFYYFRISSKYLICSLKDLSFQLYRMLFKPLVFLVISLYSVSIFFPTEKSTINLLIVIGASAFIVAMSYVILYFTSLKTQILVKKVLESLK